MNTTRNISQSPVTVGLAWLGSTAVMLHINDCPDVSIDYHTLSFCGKLLNDDPDFLWRRYKGTVMRLEVQYYHSPQ